MATAVQVMQTELLAIIAFVFMLFMFLSKDATYGLISSGMAMLFWFGTAWMWVLYNSSTSALYFATLFVGAGLVCMIGVWDAAFTLLHKSTMKKDPYEEY